MNRQRDQEEEEEEEEEEGRVEVAADDDLAKKREAWRVVAARTTNCQVDEGDKGSSFQKFSRDSARLGTIKPTLAPFSGRLSSQRFLKACTSRSMGHGGISKRQKEGNKVAERYAFFPTFCTKIFTKRRNEHAAACRIDVTGRVDVFTFVPPWPLKRPVWMCGFSNQ